MNSTPQLIYNMGFGLPKSYFHKVKQVIFFGIIILFSSCSNSRRISKGFDTVSKYGEMVDNCTNYKVIQMLTKQVQVKVLMFNPCYQVCMIYRTNFLIGKTQDNDTLAFCDKEYKGKIKIGSTVTLSPEQWDDDEKENKPSIVIYRNGQTNDLYCKVKAIYFAKINK